ncbi:MerR family transcriptional regulator [Pseudomonas sp. NC26]|uniref:MerR family transcriptional regulator n=1 Tax=Pseudomonas putida TaxID=303 RepID=A0A7W2KZS8_PSEPU|nr:MULTISPECIES: MerR family transcriptional regulator [Pseudomonas]MBA6115814.1 MerR family transcriptional regulator [Pseudomonas putida]MCZ9638041.1 MerR family transcriptional regulator [Pseudomonas putida]MEC4874134.1 MerR family transcriptional regulator [Pseudomonas sp. NC26]PZQ38126.1 MAG: MerR family DNA-binding transcriptional regulator [Pseudomonas putida]QNL86253.1 MerR family transcriptional regulator [Pseudomonas putida]
MPSDMLMPIGELARRTGVNPVTLRAWERRYGLLKPQRTAKGHRLYGQDQVDRVDAILAWLARGASVGQVRELLEKPSAVAPQGDWQTRQQQLIEAIANLSQRALDQQLNQAMALYPAVTLCEQLLLPLMDSLNQRWRNYFNAQLEQVFFHTWLRSKLGARVYHDNQLLHGPAVLLAVDAEHAFDLGLWLCAWLLSSNGIPVEVLEQPVSGAQLQRAVIALQPRALLLQLGPRIDAKALLRTLQGVPGVKLLGGATVALHQAQLQTMNLPELYLFDTPQAALRALQGNDRRPAE